MSYNVALFDRNVHENAIGSYLVRIKKKDFKNQITPSKTFLVGSYKTVL